MEKYKVIGNIVTLCIPKKSYWLQDLKKRDKLFALGQGVFVIIVISFLFYSATYMCIVLLPLLVFYYKYWSQVKEEQIKGLFRIEFRDFLYYLGNTLKAGYAVENGIKEVRKELEKQYGIETKLVKDIMKMERLIQMNISIEDVLKQWGSIVQLGELDDFITVFTTAKRTGGDSVEIVKKAANQICEKMEVQREVETLIGAKKMEFHIMTLIPLGILVYMRLSFPDFMDVLYGNLFGFCTMTICLVIYIVAFLWGEHMVKIEV